MSTIWPSVKPSFLSFQVLQAFKTSLLYMNASKLKMRSAAQKARRCRRGDGAEKGVLL
jgi:hypothetical protein